MAPVCCTCLHPQVEARTIYYVFPVEAPKYGSNLSTCKTPWSLSKASQVLLAGYGYRRSRRRLRRPTGTRGARGTSTPTRSGSASVTWTEAKQLSETETKMKQTRAFQKPYGTLTNIKHQLFYFVMVKHDSPLVGRNQSLPRSYRWPRARRWCRGRHHSRASHLWGSTKLSCWTQQHVDPVCWHLFCWGRWVCDGARRCSFELGTSSIL